MPKSIINIVLLTFLFGCSTTKNIGYQIWTSTPLSYKNFKGQSGTSSFTGQCYSTIMLTTTSTTSSNVYAVFYPTKSWLLNFSDKLLKHEQYHFNITELLTRQLRKEIAEKQLDTCINIVYTKNTRYIIIPTNSPLQKRFNIFLNILDSTQKKYDIETNHSRNKIAQFQWEQQIDSLKLFNIILELVK